MNKAKMYIWLAAASGFTGIGMLLGYTLGNATENTPLWVGAMLIILGAVLAGMAISSRQPSNARTRSRQEDETTSDPMG